MFGFANKNQKKNKKEKIIGESFPTNLFVSLQSSIL